MMRVFTAMFFIFALLTSSVLATPTGFANKAAQEVAGDTAAQEVAYRRPIRHHCRYTSRWVFWGQRCRPPMIHCRRTSTFQPWTC